MRKTNIKAPFIAPHVTICLVKGNADGAWMIGDVLVGVWTRQWACLCLGLFTCIAAQAASAADCLGHPDALGTSRTLVVDPREHPRIGTMQYAQTLPLGDHEVVLTFDDGPLPRYSNQILDILASQCVKATFFIIGRMAQGKASASSATPAIASAPTARIIH